MAAEWYCQLKGQQVGPVSPAVLRDLASAGTVTPDTLVRKGADGPWVVARRVQGLFEPSGSRPAPAAPVTEKKPTDSAPAPLAQKKPPIPPPPPPPKPKEDGAASAASILEGLKSTVSDVAPSVASETSEPSQFLTVIGICAAVVGTIVVLVVCILPLRSTGDAKGVIDILKDAGSAGVNRFLSTLGPVALLMFLLALPAAFRIWRRRRRATMAAQWYYQVKGHELGPVSLAQLRALAGAGTVTQDTMLREGADGSWVSAKQLQGLFEPAGSRPAPAVPVSETKPTGSALALGADKTREHPDPRTKDEPYKFSRYVGTYVKLLVFVVIIAVVKSVFHSRNKEDRNLSRAQACCVQAAAYLQSGDFSSAIADCTEAIRLDPKLAEAYCCRGVAYLRKSDFDKSIADCTQAIRLNAKLALAYATRGTAYLTMGDLDKALIDLNEAIRLDPKQAGAYGVRGAVYAGKGYFSRAITDCTEALRLDPSDAGVSATRGIAHFRMADLDKALTDLNEALRLDRKYAMAYWVRSITYEQKGDSKKAKLDLDEAKRLGFNPPPGMIGNVGRGTAAVAGIHEAVCARDAQSVRSMVQRNAACLLEMEEGDFGYTPLHTAAEHGFQEMADLLLALGADVNVRSRNHETPLITAAGEGHVELALFFIAKGADVKASNRDGETALYFAATENMPTLAQTLIDKGAQVDAKTVEGKTPLQLALELGSKEVVQVLLKNGAHKNAPRKDNKTPR